MNDLGEPLYGVNYYKGVRWLEKHGFRPLSEYWIHSFDTYFGAKAEIRVIYKTSDYKVEAARGKWLCNIVFNARRLDGELYARQIKRKYYDNTREFHDVAFCKTPKEAIVESLTQALMIWEAVERTVNELLEE